MTNLPTFCLSLTIFAAATADEPIRDDATNSVGMTLKHIPAGKFVMGATRQESRRRTDEPQRSVKITRPFLISTTEVTQAQWSAVMKTEPWAGKTWVQSGPQYAAAYISWNDAQAFCQALSEREQKRYRLPTEAEWEYACRADSTTAFCFGDDEQKLPEFAFIGANSFDVGERYSHPVAQKKANAFGLYDMHGNNWEWCSDRYAIPTTAPSLNPTGPETGSKREPNRSSLHTTETRMGNLMKKKSNELD